MSVNSMLLFVDVKNKHDVTPVMSNDKVDLSESSSQGGSATSVQLKAHGEQLNTYSYK